MGTEPVGTLDASWFARLIGHQRPLGITVGIALVLVLAPFGAAYLDGIWDEFLGQGYWRLSLLPAVIIIYILAISPILTRMEANVIQALRPVVQLDDEHFDRLVKEASHINPWGEASAFGVGFAFGLWNGQTWFFDADLFWLKLYLPLSTGLMFGLLGWTIFLAVAGTRLTAKLHRQPLRIDIFDIRPFEPIGRQSLIIALVFVGGLVLAVIFGLREGSIFAWQNWVMYAFVALVPVLVFFLNMRDTHRVLAVEKKRELEAVQRNILSACRALMTHIEAGESTDTLAAEINALAVYEARVQAARTWPYNTAMLRTLFFGVIIPVATAAARGISELLFD
jgi:hypothetical protein